MEEEGLKPSKNPKSSLSWKNADFFHFGAFSCSTTTRSWQGLRKYKYDNYVFMDLCLLMIYFTPTSPGLPLKILFDHLGDVKIWCPGHIPIWHPRNILIWLPMNILWKTFLGRPMEDILRTSQGRSGAVWWMSLNLILLFLSNLFDWSNVSKSNTIIRGVFKTQRNF